MHGVDHGARAKEQHRLEERMREEVEHRRRIDPDTCCHKHVAKLGHGRISNHPFDVILHKANGGGDKGGGCAKEDNEGFGFIRIFDQRRHARHQEHARGHHGGGVDQGRHRGWAFHRIRQPCVQAKLCRFAHRADEQQEGHQVGRVPFAPQERKLHLCQRGRGGKNVVKLDAFGQKEDRKDTKQEAKIANAVDHKGLDCGGIGGGFFVVKPDQQIGGDAHTFPAKEHL